MKKFCLISLSALLALCACGDKQTTDGKKDSTQATAETKDSLSLYLEKVRIISLADSVKEINEVVENHYTWTDAISACPNGYRLPTVDEFKKLSSRIGEFAKGDVWWTANVTENISTDTANAGAVMAYRHDNALAFKFKSTSVIDIAKVKCIQDTSGNKVVINDNTQNISEISGSISEVKFTPYYETSLNNMGCSDCCCEEGNGGVLDVTVQTDSSHTATFQIKELSESFCGALTFKDNNTPKDIQKASDGCTPAVIENFKILQLFQPNVMVKRTSCTSPIYLMTNQGNSRKEVSCGETITLEFAGKLQDIALAQNDDPEAEKECNYTFLINDIAKPVVTRGTCSNAEPGNDYNASITISLDAVTSRDASPILQQEFPCCYGEIQSHQITNISLTSVNP